MTKPSLDEIIAKRRFSASEDGEFYKAVVLDDVEAKAYNPDVRAQKFVMTSEREDRYGDVVRQGGGDLTDFLRNPVGLAYHNHSAPIGWWSDVKMVGGANKRHEGVLTLHPDGTTEAVDEIDRLLQAGAIRACSIGFIPKDYEWIKDADGKMTWGIDFLAWEMLECSVCSIPANPDALAKAAGGDMRLAAELFEKVLDTYCEEKSGGLFVRKEFADAYMAMKAPKTVSASSKDVMKLKVEFDLDEAERQAESFIERWSKKFGEMFKAPDALHVADEFEAYRKCSPTFMKDGNGNVSLMDDAWPEKFMMSQAVLSSGIDDNVSRDGDIVVIRCVDTVAKFHVDGEDEGYLFLSFVDESDPTPKIIEGSREKAFAASEATRQRLREKGLLT